MASSVASLGKPETALPTAAASNFPKAGLTNFEAGRGDGGRGWLPWAAHNEAVSG